MVEVTLLNGPVYHCTILKATLKQKIILNMFFHLKIHVFIGVKIERKEEIDTAFVYPWSYMCEYHMFK